MKFQCYTLGCKVNQYETQAMEQLLTALGHERGERDCDLYIINTCTVTSVADRKDRTLIHRIRREHPNAVVGVCGCYAQLKSEEVRAMGVDVVGGSGGREAFLQMMLQAARDRTQQVQVDEALRRRSFESLPAGGLATRTRAMLKVQDGCCNFCTYCIIPYARGPVRSLPLADAVRQAKALSGYREIVVTGIEVASWGAELRDGSTLTDLLCAVCDAVPEVRIRLGSLEPRVVTRDFCEHLRKKPNFCPQFHLSLQSGCDTVLARMHRKYDTARYRESVILLKESFPDCALTTDLIVGFPNESEEEHEASLAFLRECGFADVHVFPYSRREGTPAAAMDGQIPKAVKTRRAAQAAQVVGQLREAYRAAMVGSEQEVLFEQIEDGLFTGHAKNGVKVFAQGEDLHNVLCRVRITSVLPEGLFGEIERRV